MKKQLPIKKTFMRMALLLLMGVVLSCATPMGMTASTTPLAGKKIIKNYGKVEVTSNAWVLYLPVMMPITEPNVDVAIEEVLKEKKADALIKVHWYEKKYFFLLFGFNRTIVHGEAVKLSR